MARYIITDKDKITRIDTYLVKVECTDGQVFESLEPRRLFPLSDLDHYITLLSDKEKEVALIKSLDEIDPESRSAVEACFTDYYMIPQITEIIKIEDKFGALSWTVMTDRGKIKFSIVIPAGTKATFKYVDHECVLNSGTNDIIV